MKIQLEVDEGEVGKSVAEVLRNLAPEKKEELCRQAMMDWLRSPIDGERKVHESIVIEKLRASSYDRVRSDESIRSGYDFQREMREFKSSKEQMIETVTREIIEHYKKVVTETIQADPKIQAIRLEVLALVKETFPKIVHDAMIAWFCGGLGEIQTKLAEASLAMGNMETFKENVQQRLMQIGNRIGA